MAYPPLRSCNGDLHAGMTDGAWKKAAMHRGGIIDTDFADYRERMCGIWHGFAEAPTKALPDGRVMSTPYYINVSSREKGN